MIISRDYPWIELIIQVITSSPITSSLILIGVTAPLLQAHFSRHPSQGRLAKPLFPFQSLNLFPTLLFIDLQEVSNAFHNRCKGHFKPMATSVCPSHPVYLNSCSKQSISSKQPQLHHGSSPITSSIPNQMPQPSNPLQQLFQTIHIIKATPALSWTKSNHIQHNPYRCHSTIIASSFLQAPLPGSTGSFLQMAQPLATKLLPPDDPALGHLAPSSKCPSPGSPGSFLQVAQPWVTRPFLHVTHPWVHWPFFQETQSWVTWPFLHSSDPTLGHLSPMHVYCKAMVNLYLIL